MNNDNFRDRNDTEDRRDRRERRDQQPFPGGGMTPPQFPGGGMTPPQFPGGGMTPPQFPGMQDMPRTAPPNFIPEAPEMERGQMGGPSQFGTQFGPQFGGQYGPQFGYDRRRRDFRGCLYRFTFIWLENGNSFWFYPIFVGGQFIQGFRWRRNRWEFDRINIRRIAFFRCY